MSKTSREFGSDKAWLVCLVGALFFFYTFIQMSILNSLGEPMMRDLGLKASDIAKLASSYFYGNILCLFPAGIILDRFSTRRVMLLCLGVMSFSTLALAFVQGLAVAMMCKFIFGMCGAFCLLSCVRLASRWFPSERLAFVIGVLLMVAMSGSLFAQTPFTVLADHLGWRFSFVVDAIIGGFIATAIFAVVKDSPAHAVKQENNHRRVSRASFMKVLSHPQNWLAGFYTSLMNLPVMVMFVFGNLFLTQANGLDRTGASLIMTVFLFGVILGCPAFGWISDKLGRRKLPMIVGACLAIVFVFPLMQISTLSSIELYLVFFALGFITSAQVISYPLVAESNPPELTATAQSVTSILIMAGGMAPQLFAYLLKWQWTPSFIENVPQYQADNYQHALWLLPTALILALLSALFLRDARQPAKSLQNDAQSAEPMTHT